MTKFERIKTKILGNPDTISSEKYFVTISTLVAAFFLFILCIVHIFMSLKMAPVIYASGSSLFMLGLYYFVRFRNCLLVPKIILTVGGLITLDFTWYSKFLSNGPVLFFILIFAALVIWVWEGKYIVLLLGFYFSNLLVLFYIDFHAPAILFSYPDPSVRSIDIFLSFFFYSILLIFLLYVFKMEFARQKKKAIKSDKLKSAFLANMSHEIRTPMNGILGFSELLKKPNISGKMKEEYIEVIEKSGHRMLNIINDIVDISKIESGLMNLEIEESNVNVQLEYILTFFKPESDEKRIKLVLTKALSDKESIIKTDREKVFAILTNLVKNALKYTDTGEVLFGYDKKDNYLQFYVKDSGIGIPKDRHEAIFERFVQGDIEDIQARQGAGLGLAITKCYVEMLGGKIWLESKEGIGSTFYFSLPYNPESNHKTKKQIEPLVENIKLEKNSLKILIVEDDEPSEKLISIAINEFCKEPIIARTGIEAVDICRNNPDIDLILLDIQLPKLNGYEVCHQIRQFNKEVIIIAQTAYGLAGDREKSIQSGCNDYISKPIISDELLSLIQKYF